MTDHLSFDQLCDIADAASVRVGAAAPAVASVRAHLKSCPECLSRLASIVTLATKTAALPRAIAPPVDLWGEIRQQITSKAAIGRRRTALWSVRQLAAAAALVAVASSALTALMLNGRRTESSTPNAIASRAPQARVAVLPAQLAVTEHGYTQSVNALERTLNERRALLAPSTIAIVERSLRVADSAIAEARDALALDPANRALAALFASNYERKIDLLRRATELAPRS